MRMGFCACWLFVSLFLCGNQQQQGDPYSLQLVKRALGNNSVGIIFGADVKDVPRLGDACAIAILKIVDEADLTDPKTVRAVLLTIHYAFASPQSISIDEDKNPRVTIFLLNYLKKSVRTAELQQEVQRTYEFVQAQAALNSKAEDSH